MRDKILIVDDDISLTKTLKQTLSAAEYAPFVAYTTEDAMQLLVSKEPDLILLDVMVPTLGGWEACRRIREMSPVPIIFLTALGNVKEVVKGLEMGADDYIVKPFEKAELLARIKAHLRRVSGSTKPTPKLSFGDGALEINLTAHQVWLHGKTVELTPREFDLLSALAVNAGRVVPTAELVKQAWGLIDEAATDNIKPYIHYLRKKIERDSASPRWIQTVRGVGYRFSIPDEGKL